MKAEDSDMTNNKKNKFIILIICFSVFIIYYSIMAILGPIRKMNEIESQFGIKTTENGLVNEKIYFDSSYLNLLNERAFLQSRVLIAETDSVYLTLNLSDSSANIEISGVVVHRAKISNVNVSKIIRQGDENSILSMLASPLKISKDFSTIKKEPLMIKMAPKDTSEYKPDIMPDTSITEPVNYVFHMTNGLKVYIYQEEKDKFRDRINHFRFDFIDRFRNALSSVKDVLLFRVPEYHPFIKIRVPMADAKIIYRAIPRQGQVGIHK